MPCLRTYRLDRLVLVLVCLAGVAIATADDPPQQAANSAGTAKQGAAQELARLKEFSNWITSLAFSPDGKTLAVGSYETVSLWNPQTQAAVATLKVQSGYAQSVAFSPDGRLLAVGSYQTVSVWDVASRERLQALKGHRGYATAVAFSPDGKRLATSSEDKTVRLWDVPPTPPGTLPQRAGEGPKARTLIQEQTYPLYDVAFSPDGKLLATAAGDETRVTKPGEVKLWDAASGEELVTFPEHQKAATSVAFSPDGKLLISTSFDETVNVYDVTARKPIGYFGGHGRPVNDAVFAPDNETVISAAGGRARGGNDVKIWNARTGEEYATISGHAAPVTCVALSPDGHTLATGSRDKTVALWDVTAVLPGLAVAASNKTLRAGIIGLDTSHVVAFTRVLNDPKAEGELAGVKIVAGYPGGTDIPDSRDRVDKFTAQLREMGVEIVDSIPALLEKVDVVLLESVDGRPHWEQALPVLKAGKPLFIDKPMAGSLADAVAIFEAARKYNVPIFSSSSLRYTEGAQALRNGKIGEILGCDAYSPCSLEPHHPDLFWYGIHGVESLFTVMGTGCQQVTRSHAPDLDVVVGVWEGGRIGTFRGIRKGKSGYGGTAFGTKGIAPIGPYGGYKPLVIEIAKFFRTHKPPVSEQETLEIYAFMEAADESKRQGGVPVTLQSVLTKARQEASKKLSNLR